MKISSPLLSHIGVCVIVSFFVVSVDGGKQPKTRTPTTVDIVVVTSSPSSSPPTPTADNNSTSVPAPSTSAPAPTPPPGPIKSMTKRITHDNTIEFMHTQYSPTISLTKSNGRQYSKTDEFVTIRPTRTATASRTFTNREILANKNLNHITILVLLVSPPYVLEAVSIKVQTAIVNLFDYYFGKIGVNVSAAKHDGGVNTPCWVTVKSIVIIGIETPGGGSYVKYYLHLPECDHAQRLADLLNTECYFRETTSSKRNHNDVDLICNTVAPFPYVVVASYTAMQYVSFARYEILNASVPYQIPVNTMLDAGLVPLWVVVISALLGALLGFVFGLFGEGWYQVCVSYVRSLRGMENECAPVDQAALLATATLDVVTGIQIVQMTRRPPKKRSEERELEVLTATWMAKD